MRRSSKQRKLRLHANTRILVSNLPVNTSDRDLRSLFERFGDVVVVEVSRDDETGDCLGAAYVEMCDEGEAYCAITKLDRGIYHGNKLIVEFAGFQH